MLACLKAGDVPGAASYFSLTSKEQYQQVFQALSKEELESMLKDFAVIKQSSLEENEAQYYFESQIEGQTITFPIEFAKEFGRWKIVEF